MIELSTFLVGIWRGIVILITSFFHPAVLIAITFLITVKLLLKNRNVKGIAGEKVTELFLNKLDRKQYKIINDITLKIGNSYSQVDHIVISKYGVFVIETKIRTGVVYGNVSSHTWTQLIGEEKHPFQSPVEQNSWHIRAIKQALGNTLLFTPISIIAFSGNTVTKISGNVPNTYIVRISQVISIIKSFTNPQLHQSFQDNLYSKLSKLKKEGRNYKKAQVNYASTRLK